LHAELGQRPGALGLIDGPGDRGHHIVDALLRIGLEHRLRGSRLGDELTDLRGDIRRVGRVLFLRHIDPSETMSTTVSTEHPGRTYKRPVQHACDGIP
jgi:hypothetical protein